MSIYRIASPEDLLRYKEALEHSNYYTSAYLSNDIDMSGIDWNPITTTNKPIEISSSAIISGKNGRCPVFEGNNHSIKSLNCRPSEWSIITVTPAAAAYKVCIKTTGLLFAVSGSFAIRNLNLVGTLDLSNIGITVLNDVFSELTAGGLTGAVEQNGKVENCNINVDIRYPDNDFTRNLHGIGGIAGASEGEIINCRYNGYIDRYPEGHTPAGITYMNSGFIKNSCSDKIYDSRRFETGMRNYQKSRYCNLINKPEYNSGIIDNIELFKPGNKYFTGNLQDLFSSGTLQQLLRGDVLLNLNLKDGYWCRVTVHEIAETAESIIKNTGIGNTIDSTLNVLKNTIYKTKKDREQYFRRYVIMFEALVLESPSFRKAFLQEIYDSNEQVITRLYPYMSPTRIKKLLQKAKVLDKYESSIEADLEYIDSVYGR